MKRAIRTLLFFGFLGQLIALPAHATVLPKPGEALSPGVREHLESHTHARVVKRGLKGWLERAKTKRELLGWQGKSLSRTEQVRAGMVVAGNVRIPVIPVLFTPATVPAPPGVATIDQILFSGPVSGTVTGYYSEVSYGTVNVVGDVLPFVTVPDADTFYEGSSGDNGLAGNAQTGWFMYSAIFAADPGVDFGLYDNDGPDNIPNSGDDDGFVDLVTFLHSESGGDCGNDNIWSHQWWYSAWWGVTYTTADASANGGNIQIDDYTIQGALRCDNVNPLEIGTFTHEVGHIFGLPDLYDTNTTSPSEGLGYFSLMAGGNWNTQSSPAHMSAWEKSELGWLIPTVVTNPSPSLTNIASVETTPEAYQLFVGNGEYFLVENRQPVGFDSNLIGCGLAIYHVDQATAVAQLDANQVNNRENCGAFVEQAQARYGIALEQADGLCQLEANSSSGDIGDLYPGSTANLNFNASSNPNSDSYSSSTTVAVNGISACAATMTANLSGLPVPPDPGGGVDVVFLIDNSGSYDDDYPLIDAQMPDIVTKLSASFSDIRFGLAIFRDFPFSPFGASATGDEAYELRQALTTNTATFLTAVTDLTINQPPEGGNDLPESQYEALYQTLTGLGRDLDGNSIKGDSLGEIAPTSMGWGAGRHRIVYLLTDADFHDSDTESYPGTALESVGRTEVRDLIATTYPPSDLTLFVMVAENAGGFISQGQFGDVFNIPPTNLFVQSDELTVLTGGGVVSVGTDSAELETMVDISIVVLENSDLSAVGPPVPSVGPAGLGLIILLVGAVGAIAQVRPRRA